MITIKKTDYSYRISLPKNEHVNIATVYNGLFFSIFPLEGLRVYKNNKLVQDDDSNNNVQESTTIDDDDNDENKLVNVFGKEKLPNSYSVLPLANNETKKQSQNEKKNKENDSDGEDEGIYDTMSSYLTKYLPSVFSKENQDDTNNVIHITIPIDNNKPVILLQDLLNNYEGNELFNINENVIDYNFLEKMVKDFFIQFDFLLNNGYVFNDISLESVLHIQNRFVIFDSTHIEIAKEDKKDQVKNMNKAFLKLINQILKSNVSTSELLLKLKNIQNTKVFYFLKRIEREGKMLWI